MGCVNKNNREFLQLVKDINLDANTLELIIHKYWLESGSEEFFPSELYIQAQLGNTEYQESHKDVRDLWEMVYKEPQVFKTAEDLQTKMSHVQKMFPKEVIVHYHDAKGNYVLRVRKPVEHLSLADGKVAAVYNQQGYMLPAITAQEQRDFELISRQMTQNSGKSATFAPEIIQELNNKVLSNLEQTLQLDKYESRDKGNARADGQGKPSADGGLLGESQSLIQGRNRNLRETQEQRVLTPKEIRDRNTQDKAALTELAEKQGRWRPDVDNYLERDLGPRIGKGSEALVYRIPDGPVLKARTIDPDIDGGYPSIEEALTSIEIHNRLFPETAMKIVGYGESDGEFTVILEQPYIDGRFATNEEIEQFISQRFQDSEKDTEVIGNTSYKTAAYLMQDLKPQNVIVKDGKLYVIDGDFYLTEQHKQYLRLKEQQSQQKPVSKQPKSERQVIGPQPFTFNDGTTVTVPFKPNEQQAAALNAMNDFIHSDETSMTLSGYAGTGKTSLMEILAQKMRREHKSIMFSATTNKAAAVLQSRVSRAGFDAKTLNKVFGINVEVDATKTYNARNLANVLREADIMPGTTVIIDEASMINEENYRILNRIARDHGLKIIYVGDKAQLAPVNETQVSKVFRNTEGRVVELTQVERTDDNAILKEATNIRNGLPLSGESSFNERGEGVAFLTQKSREGISKVIKYYIQGLRNDPNFFRILAYTNKAVTGYNDYVRKLLGYTDPIPHIGEPLTGYSNWGYNYRTKSYRFVNSESYKVTQVGSPRETSITVGTTTYKLQYVPVTMENSLGESDTFNYIDIRGNIENRKTATVLANEKKALWEQYRRAVGRQAKAQVLQEINSIDQFLFVNDNIEDGRGNLLQAKTVDFGYALTIHKSQGSTFTHVLMDDVDVSKASNSQNDAANAMAMVDLGESATIDYSNTEVQSTEEVDLGDLGTVQTGSASLNTANTNIANVRQQLEYVGVSRATTTVTVISNNVKKEGSPLNPNQSEATAKASEEAVSSSEASHTSTETTDAHLPYTGTISITQNASGRLGTLDTLDEEAFKQAKATLRNPDATEQQLKEAQDTLDEIYDRKNAEMQTILDEVTKKTGATFSLEDAAGSWLGGEEYSFKVKLEAKTKDEYDKALQAISYVAEAARQDAFIEDLGKVNPVEATNENLLDESKGITPTIQIGFSRQPSQKEIAIVQKVFNEASTDEIPLDATVTKEGISFNFPTWKVDRSKHWSRTSDNSYEVSSRGDKRFSALYATFKEGTTIEGEDVSGKTIEWVYQNIIKKSGKGKTPAQDSILYNPSLTTKQEQEDFSYERGYLPLWQEWAKQNPELIEELRTASEGKVLTDQFASTRVSQARALAEILEEESSDAVVFQRYNELLQNWKNKIKNTFEDAKRQVQFEGLLLPNMQGAFRRVRFHSANSTDGRERNYSSFRNNYLSERGVSQESQGVLSEAEGQEIRETVEKLLNDSFKPQKISLRNYGYFSFEDPFEDIEVDARWKIPLLQELDGQLDADLRNDNPKNQEILDQMGRILQAKSQEELLQPVTKEQKQVEQNLTEFEKMTQQINNLLDSNIVSASEIRHVAELVVNSISDTITILQKEPEAAKKFFPSLQTDLDFQTASRREIVEAVGINNLIRRAKLQFDPEQNDYEDFDTIDQADLIIDNWDAIMTLASDIFAMNEGFGIIRNYQEGGFTTTQNPTIDYDNFNNYSNDPEGMAETEKDEQEHWQVEQRTIDILNSMSQLVRLALHECYQMDKDGNPVVSKWGITERVNPRQAVNSILRWTQGSLTLENMIQRLSTKSAQSPWLNQLIERLSDKSGKEADFQSQFFGVFQKHFQNYSVVLLEDGKYHSIPVNSHPALSEAMQTITTQFRIGEHPLFTANGINRKLLGSDSTTGPKAEFNLHKALSELNTIQDKLQHGEQLNVEMTKQAQEILSGVVKLLGYPVAEENIEQAINEDSLYKMTKTLGFMVKSLDAARDEQNRNAGKPNAKPYNPFAFGADNSIGGTLRNFLTPITDTLEDTAISAFYDSGKMYQSYVTPSFMTKLMNKFRLEGQEFEDFIMKEYGSSEWFKSAKNQWDVNRGWRNEWLRLLATDENAREVFDHKVELNFNKHNYMRNMSDAEYTLSLITEYFAETGQKSQAMVPAWFRIPMLSNKPSSEFIKFLSYRGANYKDEIIYGLHQMFNQELSRIQTVNMRNHSKNDPDFIKNFDTNGRKFNFLPFLNQYLDKSNSSELAKLLQKKAEGLTELTSEEEGKLSALVDVAIRQDMENRTAQILNDWENNGIFEAAKNIDGIGSEDAQVRAAVENFLWNDNFASKNILQLTITDIAFYKDAEDLQKRLAQIHAPGIRGNVAATNYEGNPVTDGKYRTFILQDFDSFKSNIIDNIAEVFDRRIAAAPENQKEQLKALKESLVGKDGKYTKINVTDAQGYSSPSSYRKKAFIFGRWSHQAEDIYQKLLKGEYNYTDLETAFQPLKPFVYSHLQKNMGVENAPISSMPVPFQAKNAEYLLIMADAILKGEELSRPNLLRAVYRVMEESERLNPTKGIDTVQFESAIKSGLQGRINIHQFLETPGGEEAAYTYMMKQLYQNWDGSVQEGSPLLYNTDVFVHEAPYEDYCLQQEVPEHFKNHSQAHGSQIRMITPSDLDFYKNPNADHNDGNNQVFYEWTGPDGTHRKLRADEFRREYEQTIAENIRESIDNLASELHIYSNDKKERNIALSKILQREILSSPRYGIDLIQACSIDRETGEFRIPKGDPIQAKRIEQLINSIIKNRVNKQKIAGGPIVQVSNFGTSRQLHIRFNDRNGGVLMTREEYEKNPQKKELSQTDKFNARYGKKTASTEMSYEEYVRENQAGIAYFEVFMPIWANKIFEKFSNEDGTINMEALEATDPELLKMVSYRIPTEDKYSCAPMKVVGFMPREAGDAIMLPYELTEIDDSDFDVDKRYVMRKDIPIVTKKKHIIRKELFDIVSESYQKWYGKDIPASIASEIEVFLDSPETMKNKNNFTKWLYSQYQRIAYTTEAPTSGRTYRDNKIVDMTLAVLTNEMTADKILNPGGFDAPKRMGYMVAAYKNPANNYSWQQLQQMSIDELKDACYTDKDLTWADTQVQFYKQNSAAASLIGVFAVNKVAHATLESNDILLAVDEICGPQPFTIADTEFGGRMHIDAKYDQQGNLIGKTLGSLVSASADAVKDPILNLMNVNMTTAGMLNTMLRLGMSFDDAALFLSQDVVGRLLNEFNRENLTNYQPLSTIVENHLAELREKYDIPDDSNINSEPLSRDELIQGLLPSTVVSGSATGNHEVIDYKVLLAFQKLRSLTDAIRKPTFATRFNSISSAVGPLIIDNLIIEHKMEQFRDAGTEDGTHFYTADGNIVDIDDIFYDHPVLKEFAKTVDVAKIMFSDMPAGSTGFRNLLTTLPEGLIDKVYNDKKLLDDLSNFYQSYLLIASRMVNPANLKKFIDNFPKYFNEQKFKEKYPDNTLIQAIRMNVAKRTGRPFLQINITGIDEAQKEIYHSAWIDLHKDNPELSMQLFEYCFFRAGIGFSPKTFMSLVPTYVKERLSTDLGNGSKATYVDTYRNFPDVNPNVVIDQWIRNNWNNNKLVPKKGGEGTSYIVDLQRGTLIARTPKDMADLKDNKYIKTRHNDQTYLWKQLAADKYSVSYVRVTPLGNNGEYMEMSLSDITKPLSQTTETIEDMDAAELKTTSPAEADAEAAVPNGSSIGETDQSKLIAELADLLMKQNPKSNKTQALNQIEKMKEKPSLYVGFLVNVFKQKGLNLTKEEALKEFKKYC